MIYREIEYWFSADHHFGNKSILKYENRPFKNTKQMDRAIIRNHNSVVNPDDTVFLIGDFTLEGPRKKEYIEAIVRKLNGHKHLILGNHDRLKPFDYIDIGFESVHTALLFQDLILVHDPSVSIINKQVIHLCGHVHSLFAIQKNCINVGLDVHSLMPVSFSTLKPVIETLKK